MKDDVDLNEFLNLDAIESISDSNISEHSGVDVEELCARIDYIGNCGFNNTGRKAYCVNKLNNRTVRATVLVKSTYKGSTNERFAVSVVPPGARVFLGCTNGGSVFGLSVSYSVVGCE
ncbi:hypothetical protein [Grimontia marina]|uniref:Uncharacterized protein n=1 Tax=Grimontia marina TaxID=646534 RepID=A0A128F8M3_9GAMM|nr:hypothetical protein [Grimontia marina]CZF82631.1 hypothetical protein GMA8713_02297 [Grimontia marina]